MSGMLKEFKEFALKGNAVALAIGVVMGAAFSAIINAIVEGIFTPLVGVLIGGIDLAKETVKVLGVEFAWGMVVNAVIQFLAIAVALFIVVKFLAKFEKEEPAPDPTTRACPFCFTEIDKKATRCSACTSEVAAEA